MILRPPTLRALCVLLAVAAWATPAPAKPTPGADTFAMTDPATTPFWLVTGRGHQARRLIVEGQVFAGYRHTEYEADDAFSEFYSDRMELGSRFGTDAGTGVELRLEAVRALGPRSLTGVDGDSLVFRARRAWGHLRTDVGPVAMLFGAGLIPDLWINALEQHFHQRGAAPLLTERGQFFTHSDLGALALFNTWDNRLELGVWITNGEGRNEREQNPGKDLSVRLSVTPLRLPVHGHPLDVRLHGMVRKGSQGVGKAKNDRAGAALTVGHTHYGLGAALYLADGYDGRSALQARGLDVWADARLYLDWLGGMAHFTQLTVDPDDTAATTSRVSAGLFADLARAVPGLGRLRLYALYEQDTVDDAAAPFPGIPEAANAQRVVLKLEASGAARFDF